MRMTLAGSICLATFLVGCAPAPGGTTTTTRPAPTTTRPAPTTTRATTTVAPTTTAAVNSHAPVITSFTATTSSSTSPLTTALRWSVSDPDGDPLTCRIDLDNNGSYDSADTVSNCTSTSSRTRTFSTVGTRTVRLEVSDGTNATTRTLQIVVANPAADDFQITLRLGSGMTQGQQDAFNAAKATWEAVIATGVAPQSFTIGADWCETGMPAYSGTVDDILIDALVTPIDGPNNVLGSAGPCYLRISPRLPIYGIMKFDSADIGSMSTERLTDVIIHEMGHVLGFGTIWDTAGVLSGAGSASPTFTGPAALGRWSEIGGTGNVPVEGSAAGPGTADAHWRESTFDSELMTGYIDAHNALSALSVASMADIGYGVDLGAADPYTPPWPALRSMMAGINEVGAFELDHIRPRA